MILVIDNYDSFTYNLVQYLGELGAEVKVVRNDEVGVEDVEAMKPERILLSPGPCTPNDAGITLDVIRHFAGKLPLLGVCLGHQAMGQAFGGEVIRAPYLMHGKTSQILHDGKTIFAGIGNPFTATRYHSLIAERESLPNSLRVTAETTDDGEIMALEHASLPIAGVQFHPESIASQFGAEIVRNFFSAAEKARAGA